MSAEVATELWTVNEFADFLRVTSLAARGILRRRELPPEAIVKFGRRVRIHAKIAREFVLRGKAV